MADAASDAAALAARLQKWVEGKATLREVRGYSRDELHAIAKVGYFFYYQGKVQEARTIFQGLFAVDPADAYFAKALAVVEMAAGNPQGALSAYDVALRIAPQDSAAYVGRAEVKLAQGQKPQAAEDLKKAQQFAKPGEEGIISKVSAMLQVISRR